jgi:hypothetical protein
MSALVKVALFILPFVQALAEPLPQFKATVDQELFEQAANEWFARTDNCHWRIIASSDFGDTFVVTAVPLCDLDYPAVKFIIEDGREDTALVYENGRWIDHSGGDF